MFADFTDLADFTSLPNFEDYLLDAQLEGQQWMASYESVLGETRAPTSTDANATDAASSSSTTAPFFEGLFLSTLCNKLESLYENSFATNLKLSSVLSKLSYCPSPVLHDFLFNPHHRPLGVSTTTTGVVGSDVEPPRLILHVLATVWNKGVKRATRMQNFARRKEEARQRLNQHISQNNAPTQTRSVLAGRSCVYLIACC